MNNTNELYCLIDKFCKVFIPDWQQYLSQASMAQTNHKLPKRGACAKYSLVKRVGFVRFGNVMLGIILFSD